VRGFRWLATTALFALWLLFLAPAGLGGPVSVIWVQGTSMQPTLHGGDLAVVYEQNQYEVGDIVAFDIPEGGVVIHRVIAAGPDGYRFQGDNRARPDPWMLTSGDIVGREVVAVPGGARVLAALSDPRALALMSSAVVFLWVFRRQSAHVERAVG
jgi:signal peptidase I